jgi:hypothetical protein
MAIQAQVEGVGTLEFPDGTDPAVIQRTVKKQIAATQGLRPTDLSVASTEGPGDPLEPVYRALQKADAAGNTADAKQLADYIRSQLLPQPSSGMPSADPSQPGAPSSVTDDVLRKIALGGRAAAEGVMNTFALPLDAAVVSGNALQHGFNRLFGANLGDYPTFSSRFSQSLTDAGAPVAQTTGEQMGTSLVRGATGALTGGALLGAAGVPAPALTTGLSGATGAGASELTRQHGGGPIAQMVAGMAGGLAPSAVTAGPAAIARALVRGGETGRQRMIDNLQTFESAGTTPSVGQATQSAVLRGTESLLSRVPGGAGVMAAKGQQQAQQIGSRIEDLADSLAPQASGEQAGRAILKGVTGEGGFVDQFKSTAQTLYDKLDQYVQPNTKFALPNTTRVLDNLTQPIYGAEKTSNFFINSKIGAIKDALASDLQAGGNALPYEAVKKLRTLVGNQLADSPFNGDVPMSQWKKLYGALSTDMEYNAAAVGPQAESALTRANTYYAAASKRLDAISTVIDKSGGPEAVFRAATSGTQEGATTLRAIMQSLPQDAQQMVTATVLRRLGRAQAGAQDDSGDLFSTNSFLTNWNTLSSQAKGVLFNRYGPDFRENMDQIAKAASNLRDGSAVFRNPSGTGQAVAQTTAAATFVGSLLTGNVGAAGAVAGAVGGSNIAARILTNPAAVRWLARTTRMPTAAIPALINQAGQSSDADLRDLASQVRGELENGQDRRRAAY